MRFCPQSSCLEDLSVSLQPSAMSVCLCVFTVFRRVRPSENRNLSDDDSCLQHFLHFSFQTPQESLGLERSTAEVDETSFPQCGHHGTWPEEDQKWGHKFASEEQKGSDTKFGLFNFSSDVSFDWNCLVISVKSEHFN